MDPVKEALIKNVQNSSGEKAYIDKLVELSKFITSIQAKICDWQWDFQFHILAEDIENVKEEKDIDIIISQLKSEINQISFNRKTYYSKIANLNLFGNESESEK